MPVRKSLVLHAHREDHVFSEWPGNERKGHGQLVGESARKGQRRQSSQIAGRNHAPQSALLPGALGCGRPVKGLVNRRGGGVSGGREDHVHGAEQFGEIRPDQRPDPAGSEISRGGDGGGGSQSDRKSVV